jgi:hypothetical protein
MVKHGTTLAFKLLLLVVSVPIQPDGNGWCARKQANLVALSVLCQQASGLNESGVGEAK